MKLDKRIIEALESNEFNYEEIMKQGDKFYLDINQTTNLGEDWWFTVWFDGTYESFMEYVRDLYRDFDIYDEAEPYINNRGTNGIPNDIKALIEDSEWKKEMLGKLVDTLEEILNSNCK